MTRPIMADHALGVKPAARRLPLDGPLTHSCHTSLCPFFELPQLPLSKLVALLGGPPQPFDSLFSVTRIQTRLWDSSGRAVNHDPAVLLRTQDLPPLYEENSCLYIFTRSTLESRHNRIGERPLMFEIDRLEAWDIDEESDFRIAELLYNEREGLL